MAATVRASYYGASASEPAGATAETGITFNREDTQTGTTPIPIPNATGTNYSWLKNLALQVTTAAATAITNRKIALASNPSTGLTVHFKAAATYAQAATGNKPTDNATTNDAVPSGYTQMTTTAQVFDAASVSGNSTGRNGGFAQVLLGASNAFTGGANSATALPNMLMSYDEA